MNPRGLALTALSFAVAWFAWRHAPRALAWLGLDDMELLGQAAAAILALTVVERGFALLINDETPH